MREIKFRCWDKDSEEMVNDIYLNKKYFSGSLIKECEIMQFTGLLDKQGKEIYEGDIVKYYKENHLLGKPYKSDPVKVTWGEYYDGCDSKFTCWITDDCPLSDYYSEVEVIGNIYENPELLEANNENIQN